MDLRTASPEVVTAAIGRHIVEVYKITDPQVVALAEVPLTEILIPEVMKAGNAVKEMDAALRLYSTPQYNRPGLEEFPIAREILRLFWKAEGRQGVKAPDPSLIRPAVEKLLAAEHGATRTSDFFWKLFRKEEVHVGHRDALLSILNDPGLRTLLNEKGEWTLPLGRALTWHDLIRGHPKTGVLFRPLSLPKDRESRAAVMIIARGFGEGGFPKSAISSFREGWFATLQVTVLGEVFHAEIDSLRLPLRGAQGRTRNLTLLKKEWKKVIEFWQRLGLEKQFTREFQKPEQFWNSRESLIQLYLRLKGLPQ